MRKTFFHSKMTSKTPMGAACNDNPRQFFSRLQNVFALTGDLPQLLILMKGHPGVGKSTIARHMARLMGFPLIDKDDARDCLGLPATTNVRSRCESENNQLGAVTLLPNLVLLHLQFVAQKATRSTKADANALSYEIMWRYAQTQMNCGLSVIVDCPLAREELYQKGAALADEACTQPSCTLLDLHHFPALITSKLGVLRCRPGGRTGHCCPLHCYG